MTSFGKVKPGGKFYYGDRRDTPWNRDLLWIKFIHKEQTDMERPLEERIGRSSSQIADMVHPDSFSRTAASAPGTKSGRAKGDSASRAIRQADEEVKRLEKQIEKTVEDEKRRRKIFEGSLAALEARLKAAKEKQVGAIKKKLNQLKQTQDNFSMDR